MKVITDPNAPGEYESPPLDDKANPVSIFGCASCGENHKDVEAHEFNAPDGEGTVSGIFCPKTGVEVYLYPDDMPDLSNKNAFMMWLLSGPPFKPLAYKQNGAIHLILEDCSYGEYPLNDQITLLLRNHTVDDKKAGDICGAIIHFIPDELSN